MIERNITSQLVESLQDTPVVLLVGARQTGKSTLVKSLESDNYRPEYVTFDDLVIQSAAKSNPKGFIQSLTRPVILDEVQRAPEIFLPIKEIVDQSRKPGDFLLTGSSNVLALPNIADSLAGRIEVVQLRPFSQSELKGTQSNFIDLICGERLKKTSRNEDDDRKALFELMLKGGFPEAVRRKNNSRRNAWFMSYFTTLIQRDIRDLANIEGIAEIPRLLNILAARTTGITNFAELSSTTGLARSTMKRYLALLSALYIIEELPAYSGSHAKRAIKSPKLHFSDTGLLAHLLGLTWEKIKFDPNWAGMVFESFVFTELSKHASWSDQRIELMHFRTSDGYEVDFVVELPNGEIVGIEVKSSASVNKRAFRGLRRLQTFTKKKFKRGIVLYSGSATVPFGDEMWAVPVSAFWR